MSLEALITRTTGLRVPEGFTSLLPGLGLTRSNVAGAFYALVFEPAVCLVIQGEKETRFGGRVVTTGPGQLLLVSHALPLEARVSIAEPSKPYLSLTVSLDIAELWSVAPEVTVGAQRPNEPLTVVKASETLTDVIRRYLMLVDEPESARVLLPLVRRELHYRLLMSDKAAVLWQLVDSAGHASSILRAIHLMRARFTERIDVEELARTVGMSPSSFYKHFKSATSLTPGQYWKDLRLTEAQRLLGTGEHNVSSTAFAVGYESPSQFSRDYARRYGVPPSSDLPSRAGPLS